MANGENAESVEPIVTMTDEERKELETDGKEQIEECEFDEALETFKLLLDSSGDSEYLTKVYENKINIINAALQIQKNDIENLELVKEEFNEALLKPSSLEINKVIVYRNKELENRVVYYIDYSAMNRAGGYVRDYAYSVMAFDKVDYFSASFKSNYENAVDEMKWSDEYYEFNLDKLN